MGAEAEISKAIEAIHTKAKEDPIWFFENILNVKTTKADKKRNQSWDLDIWQKELVEAVADVWRHKEGLPTKFNHDGLNKITVRAMHGPGKTFGVAGIMHLFNFVFAGTIVATAPKEKQLKTRLWPAFRKIHNRANDDYSSMIKVDSLKITWCDDEDWVAHGETASEPENLAGYHDEHLLFIVDEASGMKEEMFPVIEGAVSTGYIVIILLIGNPTKNIGTFHDSHMNPKIAKHWYPIHVDLNKTTRVSKQWVKEMEEKYGKDSPVVKVRCYGDFADLDENQLLPLQWLYDANEKEVVEDGSLYKLRISADIADGGIDSTVITVAHHYDTFMVVLKQLEFNFPPAESPILAAKKCMELFEAYDGRKHEDDMVIDALGVGAGTAGYLIDKGYIVVAYRGGESSDDTAKWRNRRTQSYMVLRDAHRDGEIIYADDFTDDWDGFTAQMCSIKTKEGTERVEDLMTKKEMKALGIKSPDKADSVAMQYATQSPTYGSGNSAIEVVGESLEDNYDAGLT